MKREVITDIAQSYVSRLYEENEYPNDKRDIEIDVEEAFIDGANWRINSVWHDAKEDPKEKEMLVVIDKYGDIIQSEFMIYEFLGREKWSDYVIDVGIVMWCYRKDLLPSK